MVVSEIVFFSDDPSSNPAKGDILSVKLYLKETKIKIEAGLPI